MPKIVQINITANWGSTGKIAESIGMAALSQGWESYIAYGRWANTSSSRLIKVGNSLNKYLHFAEQRIFDNEGLCSRRATRDLISQIDEIKPDIVQLHNIHDHYLNYRLLFEYLNQTDIKVVWTFHDCWAFTGHCFHFVTAGCEKWKSECSECPMKNVFPKTMLDCSKKNYELKKRLFSECKNLTIVPCSDWMASFVRHSFLKGKKIEVIKNGIDLTIFKPSNQGTYDGKFCILAVSNVWNQEKGLYDIYRLRSLLTSEYLITVVGLSEKQIKVLPTGITGIKRTQNVQELVNLYAHANVLINPTYADTFPTVNLEALACGTPVITYKTGGSPEAIDDKTGLVVSQGDVEKMAIAIRDICSKDRATLVKDCRERAEKEFDKNKCFEKYLHVYDSLLN